jgi:O-acetylhomoserine (thiol)-lyase
MLAKQSVQRRRLCSISLSSHDEFIMPAPKPPAFETLSLHAGQHPDPVTGARAVPIYQTTSYVFQDSEHAAALFNLERAGHIYTRISNPTTAVLEERLAALEGGVGAICTASGMAAMHLAIATLLGTGDHIVASSSLYGGTINLLAHTLPRFGITTSFVKPRALDEFRAAIQPNTRLVIGETIGNPGLEVLDIPNVAQIAHDAKIPLLIDNTFATPYLSRPIELGTDIVMNSATKWIGGHGIAIGGVVVDGGKFDWHGSGKFPVLTEPYAGYHGIVFDEQFGTAAFIMRARTEGLRDFGACLSPTNAFQLLQGVETLGVRMDRHVANTHAVLEFLTASKAVDWVLHPSLQNHPDYELAKRLLPRGAGSIVSFGIKGGRPAGKKFIEALRMISHLANVGDAKTLVIHPASTTHQQMDAAQLKAAGVGEELVRLSVGIESVSDIIDDLGQALRFSQKV